MPFSIYVACASSEIERAERWIAQLRAEGVLVTSSWPQVIRKAGAANPVDASHEERVVYAHTDVIEVDQASGLWLLMPPKPKPSQGAFFEFGYALAKDKRVWISGPGQFASVFTALAPYRYETDEEACTSIVNYAAISQYTKR